MSVVELNSLSKWYGEVIGLNNVTARVGAGITGLLGPNGAGKSTMMGLITGQLKPSKGSLRVLDAKPWNNPGVLSQVGYCPEGDPFWHNLTGAQFVRTLAGLSGLSGRRGRQAADETIELVGMTANMNRAIRGYSKGMRQRIKIAQALVHQPKLLVLDEPFTGADPVARHELMELFRKLAGEGIGVLVSSHVLHEVEALTSQILMISHGRIVAEGDVRAVRRGMQDRPHAIRVRVDRPRDLAARLVPLDLVGGITFEEEDTVLVRTTRPEEVYDQLSELILADDLIVREMSTDDASLEAVFGYLTGKAAS
jgi:ABC-2 type transport system ATP-binding protein